MTRARDMGYQIGDRGGRWKGERRPVHDRSPSTQQYDQKSGKTHEAGETVGKCGNGSEGAQVQLHLVKAAC